LGAVGSRRDCALALAERALVRRDFSERGLRERLLRAGADAGEVEEALARLCEAGILDDARFAAARARTLAERGRGNAAIRFDLAGQGVSQELADDVIAELEPERERAERVVARRGAGPKTARLLAGRGFADDQVARAAGGDVAPEG
jgi:regulatory protein